MTYHGHVVGIAAGSGNAFALLPSQNASGNWIKIVQRLPVRILLDPDELKAHPLRVGLSTTVRVDLHDTSGPLMTAAVRNVPQPKQASAGDDPSVDTEIAAIIVNNAGPRAHEPARLSRRAPRLPATCSLLAASGRELERRHRSAGRGARAGVARPLTALALALGTFMQVLDTSIANVSIPTICR